MNNINLHWKDLVPKSRLTEILLAAFFAYLIGLVFGIIKDWPNFPVSKVTLFFIFSVIFPFLVPIKEPLFFLSTIVLVISYFSTVRWIPRPWRLIALAIISVVWEIYGIICLVAFTGGA